MRVTINGAAYDVPFDISLITLSQFLTYYEESGRHLDEQIQAILERNYQAELKATYSNVTEDDIALHKQDDIEKHIDNEAIAWFSFWTGQDVRKAHLEGSADELLLQYRFFRQLLTSSMTRHESLGYVEWKGKRWLIQDWKVNEASQMSFNEIITSKEIMRQIYKLGRSKWDALPYLCGVFFRQENEPFKDALIADGGERMKLIDELPLHYAVQVAFFLNVSLNIWRTTSVYSDATVV